MPVQCVCCGKWVSERTARDHARRLAESLNQDKNSLEEESEESEEDFGRDEDVAMAVDPTNPNLTATSGSMEHVAAHDPPAPPAPMSPIPDGIDDLYGAGDELEAAVPVMSSLHGEDWTEFLADEAGDAEPPTWPDEDDEDWDNEEEEEDMLEDIDEEERGQWDEEWLAEAQEYYEAGLTEEQLDNLMMYAIRLEGNLSRTTFNRIRRAYRRKLDLRTEYRLQKLIDELADLDHSVYDCCINSCCLFVGDLEAKEQCPYCSEDRRDATGRPRQTFLYIPIIPRLRALFATPEIIDSLQYRHLYPTDTHEAGWIKDVFDCTHYRDLCRTRVSVNGKQLSHNYFSGQDDIALGLAGDGIQVFRKVRRGNATVTPLIVLNYNLHPKIRTRLSNVFCLGVIPGPHGPKDSNSFIWPFKQECDQLAHGVGTFHASRRAVFDLHAYTILGLGDIPWISKVMCIKGQNGFCPCRACDIQGVSNPHIRPSPYYVPLAHPRDDPRPGVDCNSSWDPKDLPLRPEDGADSWENRIAFIKTGRTKAERDRRARDFGINGFSIMSTIPGIVMTRSFPYEGMHLFFENLIPNMINHWRGKFKTLQEDSGSEDYVITESVWDIIGQETEDAVRTIPAAFVGKLPNIATSQHLYKAEYYSFWFIYLAPILLRGRFRADKYYTHACDLSRILKACLELEISRERVAELKEEMVKWVLTYERWGVDLLAADRQTLLTQLLSFADHRRFYYQKTVNRLETCPLTIHGLLHVADEIVMSAPVWASWSFVMERFAGSLLPAVKNRRNPNAVLALSVKRKAQLSHIKNKFNLHETLDFNREDAEVLSQKEIIYKVDCEWFHFEIRLYHPIDVKLFLLFNLLPGHALDPLSVLRFPRKLGYQPDSTLRHKIAIYFKTVFENEGFDWPTLEDIKQRLPVVMPKWCKVRVKYGGDAIRGSDAKLKANERDSSYIRYSQLADRNERARHQPVDLEQQVHYGQLHAILVCQLKRSNILRLAQDRVYLLAHITPCDTSRIQQGRKVWPDATVEVTTYKEYSTSIIVDISVVEAVVGRAFYGVADKRWGIIDRSGEGARTTFIDGNEWDDDDD